MSRFGLDHPTDKGLRAVYGLDRAIGFFGEVTCGKRLVEEYDRLHPPYDDKRGLLAFLAKHGFFTPRQVQEALRQSAWALPGEMEPELRRVAEVLENLRAAAAE